MKEKKAITCKSATRRGPGGGGGRWRGLPFSFFIYFFCSVHLHLRLSSRWLGPASVWQVHMHSVIPSHYMPRVGCTAIHLHTVWEWYSILIQKRRGDNNISQSCLMPRGETESDTLLDADIRPQRVPWADKRFGWSNFEMRGKPLRAALPMNYLRKSSHSDGQPHPKLKFYLSISAWIDYQLKLPAPDK